MNTPLSFTQAANIMKAQDDSRADEIIDFINTVERSGKVLLVTHKGDKCGEYAVDASKFLMSCVEAELASSPDDENLEALRSMLSNPHMFELIFGYAFIYAVGLCATEELR